MAFDGLNPNCALWLFHVQHLQIQRDDVMNQTELACLEAWAAAQVLAVTLWESLIQCSYYDCPAPLGCFAVSTISQVKLSQEMLTQKQTAGSKTAVKPNSECSVRLHLNPCLLLQVAIQHNLKLTSICISKAVKSGKREPRVICLASQCLRGLRFGFFSDLPLKSVLRPLALKILYRKEHIWMQHRILFCFLAGPLGKQAFETVNET